MNPCFIAATPVLHRAAPAPARSACTTATTARMSLGGGRGGGPHGFGSSGFGRGSAKRHGSGSGGFTNGGGGSGKGPRRSEGGGAADSSDNPFLAVWKAYCQRLDAHPITTKAITSLVGFFIGDLIAQKFIGEKKEELDRARLARMASFGFLIHGPVGHYWYNALDRFIVGATPMKVASKVAVDQLCWAPVFTALFFVYLGLAERKSVKDIVKKIKDDTWTGVTTSWKFWPFAHAINFAFVPTSQRLLYINGLQIGYNVFLSFLGNK